MTDAGPRLDALTPPEMAERAEAVGVAKTSLPTSTTFVLAVLAGAFIALGGMFSTSVAAGGPGGLPWGVWRLVVGTAFSLGNLVGGAVLVGAVYAFVYLRRRPGDGPGAPRR